MAWAILATITILYLGNFFLLACQFLEDEEKHFVSVSFNRWVAPAENSLNDLTPEQVVVEDQFTQSITHVPFDVVRQHADLFFSSLSKTQRQKADKVNWKVEGF